MNINWRIIIPIVLLLIYALELADKLMKMNMEKAIMVAVSLLFVIVKTFSDICFTIGQKNCQMFVAKLHKFHHPHNRMRFYPAHSVLSFPDFAVDTFLPQRFLR